MGNSWRPLARALPVSLAVAILPLWPVAPPLLQTPPTSISVTVDRGAEATYYVGDPIVACVQAQTSPAFPDYAPFVRITNVQANGVSSVLYEGDVQGRRCIHGFVTLPAGRETVRADYLVVGITGQPQVVNTAQVSFHVVARTPPAPRPPAPPTATALPTPTPTRLPSPRPSAPPTERSTPTIVPAPSPPQSPPGAFSVALGSINCGENGAIEVSLVWSPSEHVDLYHVYRDDQVIWSDGPSESRGYVDPGAPPRVEIGYSVVASNRFGTRSADPFTLLVQTHRCDEPTDEWDGEGNGR